MVESALGKFFLGRSVNFFLPSYGYGGEYRYAREDKDVDVQLLLSQYLDEVTWTTNQELAR